MRIGGLKVGSFEFNAFKASFAALCFLLIYPFLELDWYYELSHQEWARVVASSVFGIVVADLLYLVALRRLGAMLCALLACFFPVFVMFAAWLFYGELMPELAMLGALIVVGSVILCSFEPKRVEANISRKDLISGFLSPTCQIRPFQSRICFTFLL